MHVAVVKSLAVRLSEHADDPLRLNDRCRAAMQRKELHLEQSKVASVAPSMSTCWGIPTVCLGLLPRGGLVTKKKSMAQHGRGSIAQSLRL